MKIAVSGKGGSGKSTVAASIALLLADKGGRVLALDADPDANLAAALGAENDLAIKTISDEIALIEERTGAKINKYGQVFKLNPEVKDVADKYAVNINGVDLLVLGAVKKGGSGCACPESAFVKALVTDLVLYKNETLIMDMEAGIEHLGRAVAAGVDTMLIVVEPGQRAVDCAKTVVKMSREIGIMNHVIVGNKIMCDDDKKFISDSFPYYKITAFINYSENIRRADKDGVSAVSVMNEDEIAAVRKIIETLRKDK